MGRGRGFIPATLIGSGLVPPTFVWKGIGSFKVAVVEQKHPHFQQVLKRPKRRRK